MASRMDRYSKTELMNTATARSDRNKSLYKKIEDLDSYTNIAGVATIENKNEIDIEKVKEMLKTRESSKNDFYEKAKEEEEIIEEEEIRNYDINDLLSKVKEKCSKEEVNFRSLSDKQKKLLKSLNEKNKQLKEEDDELEELVKTISNMKAISEKDIEDSNTDDVGLLDDLKSDTMVGDASSIKKIIDEEKEFTREFDTMQIDKSFYTSSFGFTQRDFEELKNINHKLKKDNKFIIILLLIIMVIIVAGVIFFVIK